MATPLVTPPPERVNEAFRDAVLRVFEQHGRPSLQSARIRTGIDHDTLSRMKKGDVPRIDKVIDFARGFRLNVNEWLELAGYPPVIEPTDCVSQRLIAQIREGDPEALDAARRIAQEAGMPDETEASLYWNRWLADQLAALVREFPGVAALPMPVECVAALGGLAEPIPEQDAREIYETTRALFVEEWEQLQQRK
jgi:hypothetical protein